MNTRLLLPLFALSPLLFAAQPPELTVLRQQYEKVFAERVTAPFDAAKTALDTKFATALANAISAAKQAGKLDEVLAIQDDQKRLVEKLPIPDDTDTTPAALKNLRSIYRGQLQKLEESRTANHSALLPAYTAKLTELEATLVKNDRIDEAKELRTYREGLVAGAPSLPSAPAMESTIPKVAGGQPSASPASSQAPTVKGDDRKAAEWLLGVGGQVQLLGSGERHTNVGSLPKGKFAITNLWFTGGAAKPENAAFDVLSGLQELVYVSMKGGGQSDEALRFLSTCPKLLTVDVQNCPNLSGSWLRYLAALKGLKRVYCIGAAKTDVSGLAELAKNTLESLSLRESATSDVDLAVIAQFKNLRLLTLRKTRITDAGVAQLAGMPNLVALDVSENPVSAGALKALANLRLEELGFGLNASVITDAAELLGMTFPGLRKFTFGPGSVTHADVAAVAKSWPKLILINFPTYTRFDEGTFSGISTSLPALEHLYLYQTKITDASLAELAPCKKLGVLNLELCPDITDAAIPHLAAMKSLKTLIVRQSGLTPAALIAFKKQRPDVTVK